jgi:hypothetical protein
MDLFDIEPLLRRYDLELDRRDKLTSALSFPVGVLSGLGGLLAAMARSFTYREPLLTVIFSVLLVAAVVAVAVALIFFGNAYHGETYELLPTLGELGAARRNYSEYYEDNEKAAYQDFEDNLRFRIIEATDRNANSNDRRQGYLHRANITLFIVLVLTALTGIPYVSDQVRNLMAPPTLPQTRPAPTSASNQPKPEFPPNRVIREGTVPDKK